LLLFSVLTFQGFNSFSQTPPAKSQRVARPTISPDRAVEIEFKNRSWNRDSIKIDTGRIILIDSASKKAIRLEIQETGPDSGEFQGLYAIDLRNGDFSPELFIVKDNSPANNDKQMDLKKLLDSKLLERKPYVIKKSRQGSQLLTVFNNRREAEEVVEDYEEKLSIQKNLPVKTAAERVLEAEEMAAFNAAKTKREAEAKQREQERSKLEEQERLKAEARKKEQELLSEAEREKKKKEAAAYAEEALDNYRVGQFDQAKIKFEKAVELDPTNKGYFYQYGVTLYKLEEFNKSIVYLRLADGKSFDPVERDFYVGLNLFRLKEFGKANTAFKKVEASNHPQLAAPGAFYQGMVKFDELRYEEAKEDFARVLDISNDPALDQKAEDMMEKIDGLIQFAKNKEKKFVVTASVGPQYDSNVLLASDAAADQGSASSLGSSRYAYGGSLFYRPVYERTYEFGVKGATNYIYTTDDQLSKYDTWTLTGTAPFTYKGTVFGKGYSGQLIPGYERLYLGQDTAGQPKETQNSTLVDMLNTFVMKEEWFTSINIKYRDDVFKDTPDSDATKMTFGWGNSIFLNSSKTKALITDLSFTSNNSKGDASKYGRTDITASYLAPFVWDMQFVGGISAFLLNYEKGSPARADTTLTYTATLARPITAWLKALLNSSYISNESNITTNTYKKYTIGILLAAEQQF
jgi:tetratricopeptide (TPR) repeat protein